jgi:hypothetical protein
MRGVIHNIHQLSAKMQIKSFFREGDEKYSFLNNTITVLSVDPHPGEMADFLETLSKIKIFNVLAVKTARKAAEILYVRKVHLCLMELNIVDVGNNEYYLPQKFSVSTRFLAVTGQHSCSKGGMAVRCGVSEVIDKPFDSQMTASVVFRNAIESILSPLCIMPKGSAFDRTLAVLLETNPLNVDQWARNNGIAPCTLRELWEKQGIPPKAALFLWRLYHNAFHYYCKRLFLGKPESEALCISANEYGRLYERFYYKRSYWLAIISRQTVPIVTAEVFTRKKFLERLSE